MVGYLNARSLVFRSLLSSELSSKRDNLSMFQVKDLMKVLKEAKQEIPVELLELHDSNASFSNSRGRSSSFSRSGSENRYNKSYTFQDRQRRHSSNWDD
jgi:hypothetical protein